MTKVAIWCRHEGDNIIGIGANIPWNVPSDTQKFNRLVENQNIIVGRTTYETLPNSFNNEEILVLTSRPKYELRNKKLHQIVNDIRLFKDFEEDLYICGGAKVYYDFMSGGPKLMPDIIVDCIYHGELLSATGQIAEITPCIEIMDSQYFKMSDNFKKDNVTTSIYIKRGDFVDQSVLKSILKIVSQ